MGLTVVVHGSPFLNCSGRTLASCRQAEKRAKGATQDEVNTHMLLALSKGLPTGHLSPGCPVLGGPVSFRLAVQDPIVQALLLCHDSSVERVKLSPQFRAPEAWVVVLAMLE